MGNNCMPGMAMPGCGRSAGWSIRNLVTLNSTVLSPGMRTALLIALALSTVGLAMFLWRLTRRRQISGYQWVGEWLGHGGAHAVGMILMATLMLGWVPTIGPAWPYLIAYGALALLFAVRAAVNREVANPTDDLWHVFVQLSMVYMFGILWQGPVVALTAAFLVFYGALSVREAMSKVGADATLRRAHEPGGAAGTIGHLTISGSMVMMFVAMQWPSVFGRAA